MAIWPYDFQDFKNIKHENQKYQSDVNDELRKKNESNENSITDQQKNTFKMDEEKKLGKQEAEAILNALKANENNVKNKKYKAMGYRKLEKDW